MRTHEDEGREGPIPEVAAEERPPHTDLEPWDRHRATLNAVRLVAGLRLPGMNPDAGGAVVVIPGEELDRLVEAGCAEHRGASCGARIASPMNTPGGHFPGVYLVEHPEGGQ